MQKLIALIAIVLMCGFSFAQNQATVNQTGGNQKSDVEQSGGTSNTATVDQLTDNGGVNKSTVIQNGTNNTADVDQFETGGGGNAPGTEAYLNQIGTKNYGKQLLNSPGWNSGQSVWGKQEGTSNELYQTINGGYTTGFSADQYGEKNIARQTMNSSNSDGRIEQDGKENIAVQDFTGQNHGYYTAGMLIDQDGNNNSASQTFNGGGWGVGSNGQIIQNGNRNDATQNSTGFPNTAIINQQGSDNDASQLQNGNFNNAKIDQLSNNNDANLDQAGDQNRAFVTQKTGEANVVNLKQTGGSQADILQDGGGNVLMGLGLDDIATSLNGSVLDLDQLGTGNILHLQQTNGAKATVMQNGVSNTAIVIQN